MSVALVLLTTVVLVPLAEEVLFRQLLLGWLLRRLPVVAAVVVCSVVFALCHLAPVVMLYVLPMGIGLAVLRLWHGTLWASLIPHAANNALVTGIALASL